MNNNEITQEKSKDLFVTRTGNETMRIAELEPDAKMLFLNLFAENDVAILFADSGVGKSILAVQMGVEMARNGNKVAYFDFELNIKQFAKRYTVLDEKTGERENYNFPENFNRIEMNGNELANVKDYQKELFDGLEKEVKRGKYKVIILDNLTAMMNDDGKDTKIVINIIKKIRQMREDFKIAILVIAHTPKTALYNPISKNDLAGSKILSNLVDNIFSIGASTQGKNTRYIKQLKMRDEKHHEADNVIVCEIVKENCFLHFQMVRCSHEREHLQDKPETEKDKVRKQVIELKKETPAMSSRQASDKMGGNISHATILDIWKKEGIV